MTCRLPHGYPLTIKSEANHKLAGAEANDIDKRIYNLPPYINKMLLVVKSGNYLVNENNGNTNHKLSV